MVSGLVVILWSKKLSFEGRGVTTSSLLLALHILECSGSGFRPQGFGA